MRGRPFSSYSSSRGGWNWAAFVKSIALAAIVFGISLTAASFDMPDAEADGINKFTVVGVVLCVVLLDRKFNWFTSQGDGVTAFNEKHGPKEA